MKLDESTNVFNPLTLKPGSHHRKPILYLFDQLPVVSWRRAKYKQINFDGISVNIEIN